MLFRETAANRPDRGVEAAASFVQAALKLLPTRIQSPTWLLEFEYGEQSFEEASRLAEKFRGRFLPHRPDDPIHDLPDILVSGGDVILSRLESSRFEGASVIAGGYPFIFVSTRFSGRMLFTLAHELGHLIAHHREQQAVIFDTASQIGAKKRYRSPAEAFVNAFASNLLMPTRGVAVALKEIREALNVQADAVGDVEILYLARFYGVSFEVAALRCEQLDLLPEGGAWSLAEHLRKEHRSPEKRGDALGLPKRSDVSIPKASSNLLRAAAKQIEEGKASLGWVTDRLGCSAQEVYAAHAASEANRGPYH